MHKRRPSKKMDNKNKVKTNCMLDYRTYTLKKSNL